MSSTLRCMDLSTSRGSVLWRMTMGESQQRVTIKARLNQRNSTRWSSTWWRLRKLWQKNALRWSRPQLYLLADRFARLDARHGRHVRNPGGENKTRRQTPSCGGVVAGYQCLFHWMWQACRGSTWVTSQKKLNNLFFYISVFLNFE